MMNGKEYIHETIERVEALLPALKDRGKLNGDSILEELERALADLRNLKTKPTLRTKDGTSMALPAYEAGKNLEDEWEAFDDADDPDMVKEQMEFFVDAVYALAGALKDQSVILT